MKWLAQREHSRAELARKLANYAEDPDEIPPLLDELTRRKLLSDDRYAETRAHALARKYGTARVASELKSKGVAAQAVARIATETRATELERARAVWSKRFKTSPATLKEWARQARFLQSRGFAFDVIRAVIGDRGTDSS